MDVRLEDDLKQGFELLGKGIPECMRRADDLLAAKALNSLIRGANP